MAEMLSLLFVFELSFYFINGVTDNQNLSIHKSLVKPHNGGS